MNNMTFQESILQKQVEHLKEVIKTIYEQSQDGKITQADILMGRGVG